MTNTYGIDTSIMTLGPAKVSSPIEALGRGEEGMCFIPDNERILVNIYESDVTRALTEDKAPLSFERAGPRRKIYFDPSKLRCAVVTCGGLCPGRTTSFVHWCWHSGTTMVCTTFMASVTDSRALYLHMVMS